MGICDEPWCPRSVKVGRVVANHPARKPPAWPFSIRCPPASEDRDRVQRRAGAADDPQRRGREQELPPPRRHARRGGGRRAAGSRAGGLPSPPSPARGSGNRRPRCCWVPCRCCRREPRAATPRPNERRIAVGCSPALATAVFHGPSSASRRAWPVRTSRTSPACTVTPCSRSAASRSSREHVLSGLQPRNAAHAGDVEQHAATDEPVVEHLDRVDLRPSAVTTASRRSL